MNFICEGCGAKYSKWVGKCSSCMQWNTVSEESAISYTNPLLNKKKKTLQEANFVALNAVNLTAETLSISTDISEFDRVLGNGIVSGSSILIGGEPGIGKSTLLMQVLGALALKKYRSFYVSGEESVSQIKLRSDRLGISSDYISLSSSGNVLSIIEAISKHEKKIDVLVVDSIQTMFIDGIDSIPGTVSQIRASANELINFCKSKNIALILIGHITKEGQIAGPKLLEHIVDVIMYFENDKNNFYRTIRTIKNRFGSINEVGIFEMSGDGLKEIKNPSELFVSKMSHASGRVVFPSVEGTRSILIEIEALVSHSFIPVPRRASVGFDSNRLSMLLAVLSSRLKMNFSDKEVYVSTAGGMKISETSADLGVCASILSSHSQKKLPENAVFIGEISLSGQIRPVNQIEIRLKEAKRMGFDQAFVPFGVKFSGLDCIEIKHIKDIVNLI